MKLLLILLLVAFANGRYADRTAALKRSNQALLKALQALTSEENAVGELVEETVSGSNQDYLYTSEWVSDNHGKGVHNTYWRDAKAMYGMECRGRKCDDKRLYYKGNLKVKKISWDRWQQDNPISEERGRNNFNCPSGEVLTGIWCQGSYCDNIIPMCSEPKNFKIVGGRTETKWISEESDRYIDYCPDNYVIIGLRCKGGNCDNIKLKCGQYQITSGTYYTLAQGSNCPNGKAITDATECAQAVAAENAMQGNRPGRNLYSGNWGHVPYGCSVQSGGDWTIHLNSRKSGRNSDRYPSGIYTPVCKKEWN